MWARRRQSRGPRDSFDAVNRSRVFRILGVTAGLGVAGGVVGGALGVLAFLFITLVSGRIEWMRSMAAFVDTAALFGATIGAVLAPIAAWTLMRHVPIWRAIVETAVGTAGGVVVGYFAGRLLPSGILWPIG